MVAVKGRDEVAESPTFVVDAAMLVKPVLPVAMDGLSILVGLKLNF